MLDPLQVFRCNDVVTYLVGVKKELVDVVNQNGETCLVYAAGFGHLDVVTYLVGVKKELVDVVDRLD